MYAASSYKETNSRPVLYKYFHVIQMGLYKGLKIYDKTLFVRFYQAFEYDKISICSR